MSRSLSEQKITIPKPIKDFVENYTKLLIEQTKSYLPFVKVAYPASKSLTDACYSLIIGNALSIFIQQYTMRLMYPSPPEFEEFGKITAKYRKEIEKLFEINPL